MSEEKEIWKVWKETYNRKWGNIIWEVSDQGNVKRNGVLYECRLNKSGYKVFGAALGVHRAVAELFILNPNNYNEVDHINGNKLDNRTENLQWCTHKQNMNNQITLKRRSESMKGKNKGKILGPQSEETRKKRSKSMKGKNIGSQSEEHKRKRSESMKRYWQNKKLNISM